jgi:hypothetical protein
MNSRVINWRQERLEWASVGDAPNPTQRVQVGLASFWQTAVGGSRPRDRSGTGPALTYWFGVEPPAGIEPATPSLPSMVGPFGGHRGTSLRSTEPQVAGLVEDREMGCCEAVRGAAAGKSLARSPVGCPVVAGLRDAHVRGSGNGSKPVEFL